MWAGRVLRNQRVFSVMAKGRLSLQKERAFVFCSYDVAYYAYALYLAGLFPTTLHLRICCDWTLAEIGKEKASRAFRKKIVPLLI